MDARVAALLEEKIAAMPPERQRMLRVLTGGIPKGPDVAGALQRVTEAAEAVSVARAAVASSAEQAASIAELRATVAALSGRLETAEATLRTLPELVHHHVDALLR